VHLTEAPINPQRAAHEIDKVLPEDAILVSDIGVHHNWLLQFCHPTRPDSLIGSMGFGSMSKVPSKPMDPRLIEARERVRDACKANGLPFLDGCTPENIKAKIDEGVRVVAGHREDTAKVGREYTKRTMPV